MEHDYTTGYNQGYESATLFYRGQIERQADYIRELKNEIEKLKTENERISKLP